MIMSALIILAASARRETRDEQIMADFARESFKAPGERRSLNGYKNVPVSKLKCGNPMPANTFALWTNDAQKELVFALRGTPVSTDPFSSDDGYDIAIAHNRFTKTDRVTQALDTLRAIQVQFPSYSIIMTGHSLGGTTALILLAQDANNNVITKENDQPRSAIASVFVYNPYKGHSIMFGGNDSESDREAFYNLAFNDRRLHGVFVDSDLLSSVTRGLGEAKLPQERLFVGHNNLPMPYCWTPSLFAHNIDGSHHSMRLTSPDYSFY